MEQAPWLRELFDPEERETFKTRQADLIKYFKELVNKLYVLQSQREAEAIPDMLLIVDFMEELALDTQLVQVFMDLPDLINFLMDTFFPDLASLIFRAGMFPNEAVLNCTARFLELYVELSIRAFKGGFPYNIRAVEAILSPEKTSYYTGNSAKIQPLINPFGTSEGEDPDWDAFIVAIKEGDMVDAVKSSSVGDCRMIWSRGIVTDVKLYSIYVNFLGENQPSLKEKLIKKAPFAVNKPRTRALDFDWRCGLTVGDEVDVHYGKKGWLLCRVEKLIEQCDNKEVYRFVQCRQVVADTKEPNDSKDSNNPKEGSDQLNKSEHIVVTINVHDPALRKAHSYSDQRHLLGQYMNEEIYEYASETAIAVSRVSSDSSTLMDSHFYINNKYYIKFINLIGSSGGFDLMKETMASKDNVCNPTLVGYFMSILASSCPYLLRRFVMSTGKDLAELGMRYIFEAPTESLKNMSREVVESIYKAFEHLARRIYTVDKAKELTENFLLKVGMIFISTDNLERKLNGVTILSDIARKIKVRDFDRLTKRELAEIIEKDNILEQIIKGHTQLIAKSGDLFRLVLEESKASEKMMLLLWTTLRKADLDTRNALFGLLNETFCSFPALTPFFITRIAEVEPKQLSTDEIDLLSKLVSMMVYGAQEQDTETRDLSVASN